MVKFVARPHSDGSHRNVEFQAVIFAQKGNMKVNQRGFIGLMRLLAILAVGSIVTAIVVRQNLRSKTERIVQSESQVATQPQEISSQASGEVEGDSTTAPQATNPIKSSPTPTPSPKESNQPSNQSAGQSSGNQPSNQSNSSQSQSPQEQQHTPSPTNTPTPSPVSNCEQGKPCITAGDNNSATIDNNSVSEVCNEVDGVTTCTKLDSPQTPVVSQDNSDTINNCLGGGCN